MTQNRFNELVRAAVHEYNDGDTTERELTARILQITAERV